MSNYVKLFGSILDSTVWSTPPGTRLTWITMLAMADQHGCVWASIPGLAKRAGVDRSECEEALTSFMQPDPDSRTKDYDGRRIEPVDGGWLLLNHDKFRGIASLEDRREKAAERQRRFKERVSKQKLVQEVTLGNALLTAGNASNDIRSDHLRSDHKENTIVPAARPSFDFAAIYARYPRRKNMATGRKKLEAMVKTQADYDAVVHGLDRFLAEARRKGTEPEFYPYFSTWVNQRRWEDEDDPIGRGGNPRAEPLPFAQAIGHYRDEI